MKNEARTFRDLLVNRNFMLYISTYHIAGFGSAMTMFAIWSQVTLMTANSPFALGLATLMNTLPGILVSPWAGIFADRLPKRIILLTCHLLRALMVALLFFSTELWQLYALAVVHSMIGTFAEPPHRSFLPLLVKKEQFVSMNAFLATLNNLLQLFRPGLAGAIVATFGYKTGFAVDFYTYFVPAIALLFIRIQDNATEPGATKGKMNMRQDFREGFGYIKTQPILMYLFAFMMLMTLAMSMQGPLTMIFVGQHLAPIEQASKITGLLFSTLGVGGIIGAFVTPRLIKKISILWLLFASLAFDGGMVIIFSQAHSLILAMICFALFGIITSVNSIVQDTIIQTIVPENLRGRVYGAFGPITGPISLLSIGAGTSLAGVIGTRAVFFIAGLMEVAAVIICRLLPSYRGVRNSLSEKMSPTTQPVAQEVSA
jgi:MFS transporter, DHA3 family, macrolide efflux protein